MSHSLQGTLIHRNHKRFCRGLIRGNPHADTLLGGKETEVEVSGALRKATYVRDLIVVAITPVELGHDTLGESEQLAEWFRDDAAWLLFFGAGTLIYLVTRLLKKHTRILEVPGR